MINLLCSLVSAKRDSYSMRATLQELSDEDWESLRILAFKHGLTAVLYNFIIREDLGAFVPKTHLGWMREKTRLTAVSNLILLQEARQLIQVLGKSNIDVIGLKGLYLLDNVYEDISLRPMADLDIMIRKEDIPQALPIIESLEFHPSTYFNFKDMNVDIKHVPPMIKDERFYLEIHWTLLEEKEPFTIDPSGLWERAVPARIAGVDILSLGLEDLILHLCLHLTYQHHLNLGLHSLYDIGLVLKRKQEYVDWDALVKLAKEWGAERVVALTFNLLENYMEITLPHKVYNDLLSQPIPQDVMTQAKNLILNETKAIYSVTPDLARLSSKPGMWNKLRLIFSRVFLPKITMARLYSIPPKSVKIYLYYPVRFFELIGNYFRSGWRILFKDKDVLASVKQTQSVISLQNWLGWGQDEDPD